MVWKESKDFFFFFQMVLDCERYQSKGSWGMEDTRQKGEV